MEHAAVQVACAHQYALMHRFVQRDSSLGQGGLGCAHSLVAPAIRDRDTPRRCQCPGNISGFVQPADICEYPASLIGKTVQYVPAAYVGIPVFLHTGLSAGFWTDLLIQ